MFVDLGGVEGLIHISELSWGRVVHPKQIVQLAQEVEVEVLELSPERCRVALSLKRLLTNPWTSINGELSAGKPAPAIITSVLSYGAFARLESGVEGLIHVSEMPLEEGQTVKGVVTQTGIRFDAKAVVLTTGTFLGGTIHIGLQNHRGGRAADPQLRWRGGVLVLNKAHCPTRAMSCPWVRA